MSNKPVAWVNKDESGLSFKNHGGGWQPLYTHPVNPYQSITNTKIEPTVVSYTHPVKELDEDFDAICLENKRLQAEIDSLKDKLMLAKQSLEIVEGWIKK